MRRELVTVKAVDKREAIAALELALEIVKERDYGEGEVEEAVVVVDGRI